MGGGRGSWREKGSERGEAERKSGKGGQEKEVGTEKNGIGKWGIVCRKGTKERFSSK
jgi:hypothetical protein